MECRSDGTYGKFCLTNLNTLILQHSTPHQPPAEPTPIPSQEGNSRFGLPSYGGAWGGFLDRMRDQEIVEALP